uniref:E2 ubiquitin-conjugating enzyme n=2 Tax=Clastoptera arizonana TaxID=38151 RepID=A0A1B6C8V9_9HEMI
MATARVVAEEGCSTSEDISKRHCKGLDSRNLFQELNEIISFPDNFEFSNNICFICYGYYGPCFGEPLCTTCHLFLYPEELITDESVPAFSELIDDGDSGNDEPNDLCYGAIERRMPQEQDRDRVQPAASVLRDYNIASRIEMLSNPRVPDMVNHRKIEDFPAEVLLAVFSYLDDLSLWTISNVCKRWRDLILSLTNPNIWRKYTLRRWPLYKPLCKIQNWFRVYSYLVSSSPCKACLFQTSLRLQPSTEENMWRRRRLRSELKNLRLDPLDGIKAIPLEKKNCHWMGTITGPVGSPYEGGMFYLYLQISYTYPLTPPVVRFLTKIFHPNISRHGDVGIDCITHNWSIALTISKVLISIQSLLTDPFCQICMEPAVGKLYLENRSNFEAIARCWTRKYAMHDILAPI